MKTFCKVCGVLIGLVLLFFPEAASACDKCFGASGDEAFVTRRSHLRDEEQRQADQDATRLTKRLHGYTSRRGRG